MRVCVQWQIQDFLDERTPTKGATSLLFGSISGKLHEIEKKMDLGPHPI